MTTDNSDGSFLDLVWMPFDSLGNFGNFGDGLGGVIGAVAGVGTLIFAIRTYYAQKKEIKRLTDQANDSQLAHVLTVIFLPKMEHVFDKILIATGLSAEEIVQRCDHLASKNAGLSAEIAKIQGSKENNAPLFQDPKVINLMHELISYYNFIAKEIRAKGVIESQQTYFFLLHQIIPAEFIDTIRKHISYHSL